MSDDTCDDCGRPFTDSIEEFRDQWEPGKGEVCLLMQNFGGYQLCAERTVERLRSQIRDLEVELSHEKREVARLMRELIARDSH